MMCDVGVVRVNVPGDMLVYLRDGSAQTTVSAEMEVEDRICYLTRSRYTDTGPTSPSADPVMPGAW